MLKLVRRITWGLAIIVVLIVALPLLIGWYLSPQDILKKVDVIIVVSGGDNDSRIEKGVELYKEGWAPTLLYSGAAAEGDVSNAAAMRNISVKIGVPKASIIIEEESKTTTENAQNSAKIIKEKGYTSMILVTSPYHQRRTLELFRKELPEVGIINQSALDNNWRKKGWWETNVGRFLTVGELGKIFLNFAEQYLKGAN
jgi:uncharacterized SAM-binding protein YcdF (DUF218 family)